MKRLSGFAAALALACMAAWAQPAAKDSSDAPAIEQGIVTAPKLSAEIKGFVQSYAMRSPSAPVIARWKNGICPKTFGFSEQKNNDSLTSRIRQIAALAGAPVSAAPCKVNIEVYFTPKPQEMLDGIRSHGGSRLLSPNTSQAERVAVFNHPIQAWYATGTRDEHNGKLMFDNDEDGFWDGCVCEIGVPPPPGSVVRMPDSDQLRAGVRSELVHVYVIADVNRTANYRFAAVTDYIAMMALSEVRTFDVCQQLPSVANLTAPDCDAGRKADAISDTDLAYLQGVYGIDPGEALSTQQTDIAARIENALLGKSP